MTNFEKPQARFIIAIASGKGGVGKSTVAINLACMLVKQGYHVGLLDADVYGPSQAHMLGINSHANITPGKKFIPIEQYGLKTISIANLIKSNNPAIWRGPMASRALEQLVFQTNWGELDYLILDLPPGTGDIPLTLCQKVPLTAAVLVTTPQDIARIDVEKAYGLFQKLDIPVSGVIENMSYYTCTHCGQEEKIFVGQAAEKLTKTQDLKMLGHIPLLTAIQLGADNGLPFVLEKHLHAHHNSSIVVAKKAYDNISQNIQESMAVLTKNKIKRSISYKITVKNK